MYKRQAQSQATFEPLAQALAAPPNLVDRTLRELTLNAVKRHAPDMVLVSAPFPGNVYGAFRIAQAIKAHDPAIVTVLGGGFVNTELRELTEPRVFDCFDYVTLDDGERPDVYKRQAMSRGMTAPTGKSIRISSGK